MAGLITSELATSLQKNKRKTFGFGTFIKKERRWVGNEVHIRELSIGEAGLGCALWDASIILGRCLFAQRALLAGKKILEVGAGCGLPAIIAGMFAAESVGTDYIDKVCARARYLIMLLLFQFSFYNFSCFFGFDCARRIQAVENLQYNINVNAEADDDEDADDEERAARRAMRRNIATTTRAAMLDWDEDSEENVGKVRREYAIIFACLLLIAP